MICAEHCIEDVIMAIVAIKNRLQAKKLKTLVKVLGGLTLMPQSLHVQIMLWALFFEMLITTITLL